MNRPNLQIHIDDYEKKNYHAGRISRLWNFVTARCINMFLIRRVNNKPSKKYHDFAVRATYVNPQSLIGWHGLFL